MAIFNAFDKRNHFSELADPQFRQDKLGATALVLTPEERKALCRYNLGLGSSTAATFGTVTTSATTTAAEYYNGVDHKTVLTLTAFAVGTSGDNASLALGAKFYTLPAGNVLVTGATLHGGLTAAISVTTDTPEIGIGTTVASGANATLSSTGENIIDGGAAGFVGADAVAIAPDVAGTATIFKGMLATSKSGLLIKASGGLSHDLFLNVADGWADVTAAGAVTFTGTITLDWRVLA